MTAPDHDPYLGTTIEGGYELVECIDIGKIGRRYEACANTLKLSTASHRPTKDFAARIDFSGFLMLVLLYCGRRNSTAFAMRCTLAAGASPTTVTMCFATSLV